MSPWSGGKGSGGREEGKGFCRRLGGEMKKRGGIEECRKQDIYKEGQDKAGNRVIQPRI